MGYAFFIAGGLIAHVRDGRVEIIPFHFPSLFYLPGFIGVFAKELMKVTGSLYSFQVSYGKPIALYLRSTW